MLQLFFVASIILYRGYSHSHGAYSHDSDIGGGNGDWMKYLYDDDRISTLSLPGTHDSIADDGDGDLVDCQSLDLTKQLNAGIRVLDIRAKISSNKFVIFHGPYYLSQNFDDVLTDIKNFLSAHPAEFILMRFKEEDDCCDDTTFANVFKSYWDSASYKDYFYKPSSNTAVPKVSEVRGKIVVLQNFDGKGTIYGLNYGDGNVFDIQDNYALCQLSNLYDKWLSVKGKLDSTNNAKSNTKFQVNYLSGSMEKAGCALVFPYFVASGHSSPGTSAPRLSTGLTTPGWSSSYPDFPRTTCTGNWLCFWICDDVCTISYEGTNILAYDYMNSKSFVGIIMMDFPGKAIIERIISKNRYEEVMDYNILIKGGISNTRKYLSTTSDGTKVDLWTTDDGSGRQKWRIKEYSGYYHIEISGGISNTRKYLSTTSDGSKVDLYTQDDASGRQRWILQPIASDPGYYNIKIQGGISNSKRYLSTPSDGSKVDLWYSDDASGRQRWKIQQEYSTIQIGSKCLDVSGYGTSDGSNIHFWDCHGGDNQLWKFQNGMIIGKQSGKCIDVSDGGTSNGANIQLWGCWGGANQKWTYNNDKELVSQSSGKCLDVSGMSTSNGANIHLWECHGGWNQEWTFGSTGLAAAKTIPVSIDIMDDEQAAEEVVVYNLVIGSKGYWLIVAVFVTAFILIIMNVTMCCVRLKNGKRKKDYAPVKYDTDTDTDHDM